MEHASVEILESHGASVAEQLGARFAEWSTSSGSEANGFRLVGVSNSSVKIDLVLVLTMAEKAVDRTRLHLPRSVAR